MLKKIFAMFIFTVIFLSSCGYEDFYKEITYPETETQSVTQTESETQTETEEAIFTESMLPKNLLSSDGGENISEMEVPSEMPTVIYKEKYYAMNFKDIHAMWFSYLEYESVMKNCSEDEFASNIENCFDNMKNMGINTVFVQVRAFGDSYYDSKYFPKGVLLTDDYDPLEIMIQKAHERGISLHAWINPMRLQRESEFDDMQSSFLVKKWYEEGINTFVYDDRVYLDPSSEDAQNLICDGVREIVKNYEVDGIHIDDYFYPTAGFEIDKESYEKSGKTLSHYDFRREKVSETIKKIYSTVHEENETVLFGISPSGNIENNEDVLFADVKKWCGEEGFCDYICPQIYYGFEHETHPFEETVYEWKNLCRDDMQIIVGLGAYKCGNADEYAGSGKNEWIDNKDVLTRQASFLKEKNISTAIFRYDSIFSPDENAKEYIRNELKDLKF